MSESDNGIEHEIDLTEYQNHIESVCAAIGGWHSAEDGNLRFQLGDEALECIKDMKRFLHHDDSSKTRISHLAFGKCRVVEQALVPILQQYTDKPKLLGAVVEVLVPLTWPLELKTEEEYSEFAPQIDFLQSYKESFLSNGALTGVLELVLSLMQVEHRDRTDRAQALIRLCLLLIRNLLCIPDAPLHSTGTLAAIQRATMQEQLLYQLDKEDVLDFLLSLAGSADEYQFAPYKLTLLEIFHLILERRDANNIFCGVTQKCSLTAEPSSSQKTKHVILHEKLATRHSRFGGTTTVQFRDGTRLNVHSQNAALMTLDQVLNVRKKQLPFRKKPIISTETLVRPLIIEKTVPSFRKLARVLVTECFNPFIASLKHDIEREHASVQSSDLTRFLQLLKFMLSYHRIALSAATTDDAKTLYSFDCVACFFNMRGMLFLIKSMRESLDNKLYEQLLAAVQCFEQFMSSLPLLSPDLQGDLGQVAQNILSNLYYEKTHADLLVQLVKIPNAKLQSREFINSVVHIVFLFFRQLEQFNSVKSHIFMRRRRKAKKPTVSGVFASIQAGDSAVEPAIGQVLSDILQRADALLSASSRLKERDNEEEMDASDENDYIENQLEFEDIEELFCSEKILDTHFYLLRYYRSLQQDALMWIVTYFHRLFVRRKRSALFCKVSYIYLLQQIMNGKVKLQLSGKAFDELFAFMEKLSVAIVKLQVTCPSLFVEMLFPKSRHDAIRIQYGDHGEPLELRKQDVIDLEAAEAEYRVKPGLTWSQQVGVLVGVLEQNAFDFEPLREFLRDVAAERRLAESRRTVVQRLALRRERVESGLPEFELASFEAPDAVLPGYYCGMTPEKEKEILAMFDPVKDLQLIQVGDAAVIDATALATQADKIQLLRQLLSTLGFAKSETEVEGDELAVKLSWYVEACIDSATVSNWVSTIDHFLESPVSVNGKPARKLLRKRKARKSTGKRKPKKDKGPIKVLSKQFIDDSDDESNDDEFFRQEAERRRLNEVKAANGSFPEEASSPALFDPSSSDAEQDSNRNDSDVRGKADANFNFFDDDQFNALFAKPDAGSGDTSRSSSAVLFNESDSEKSSQSESCSELAADANATLGENAKANLAESIEKAGTVLAESTVNSGPTEAVEALDGAKAIGKKRPSDEADSVDQLENMRPVECALKKLKQEASF